MEVLYRHQPVFASQPVTMVFPPSSSSNLSHLPVPPPHGLGSSSPSPSPLTCYSFQSSPSPYTPSRSPTPDYPKSSESCQGTTLQSVLRGEIPRKYSHFMSLGPEHQPSPSRSPVQQLSSSLPAVFGAGSSSSSSSSSPAVFGQESSSLLTPARAVFGAGSAPVLSPPPEDVQTEPMDLSCKRPSSTSSVASSSSAFHLPPSPCEESQGQYSEFSLLRNLLQVGKPPQPSISYSAYSSPARSDRSCDSPCSDPGLPSRPVLGTTLVTLAKKNLYNVSARVSDWLMKTVQFASSISCFKDEITHHDRRVLLLNSWSRLLLLFMAENNFHFAVTPLRTEQEAEVSDMDCGPSPDEPTMKSVESIQRFIRKCQQMEVESEEYYYLRMLVLFNSSYVGLKEASRVDAINSHVTKTLHQHVQSTRPSDVMHYSRLLLCLPSLYGINDKMVERLFCRHIDMDSVTDVEVLLQKLLETYCPDVHRI